MVKHTLLWGPLLALLAACGGGGGGTDGGGGGGGGGPVIDPRLLRLDAYDAQRLRVLGDPVVGAIGMPLTPEAALPAAGRADFTGAALMQVVQPNGVLSLAGDAQVSLDFGSTAATGTVDNIFGEVAGAGIRDYEGTLSLSGTVTGVAFALDYSGSLTSGGTVLVFDGIMDAALLGNPVRGVTALDLTAQIDQGGVLRDGAVVIFGEGTVTAPPPAAVP